MSFKLHGNYCGPGWSGGQWQPSVVSDVPPTDAFDATCQRHDAAYANNDDLASADFEFMKANVTTLDPLRTLAGVGVGLQGVARAIGILNRRGPDIDRKVSISNNELLQPSAKKMPRRNKILAGIAQKEALHAVTSRRTRVKSADLRQLDAEYAAVLQRGKKAVANAAAKVRGTFGTAKIATAPVSIGTTVTSARPQVTSTQSGVRVHGREFMDSVQIFGNSNWQVGSVAPLHPMYYPASVLGNTARGFQYYRIVGLTVHFVTRQSTATVGEVALCYASNALEPAENGASSAFLARVMTRGDATLGPLWSNASITPSIDSRWRLVDAFNAATFADNVAGEIQCYTQTPTVNDTAGYLLMDYDIEFKETMFTPHNSTLPWSTGVSQLDTGTQAANAVGNSVALTTNFVNGFPTGTVFKMVLDVDQSTFGTGTTAATAFAISTIYTSNITGAAVTQTGNTALSLLTVTDGTAFYGVAYGTSMLLFASYDAAVSGNSTGQIMQRVASTGTTTLVYQVYPVRLAAITQATTG